MQSYVDKDDFFISPLKHEDVILGAPWFDRLGAQMKFPERNISFTFQGKEHILNVNTLGSTIPIVDTLSLDKSMKSAISSYMIFVKESSNDVNVLQTQLGKSKEEIDLSNFLNQYQDVFIDDELPPKRGDDDHKIELIPGAHHLTNLLIEFHKLNKRRS